MAVSYLIFLLILTELTGIYSITRVSQVSVKAGGSITIPCRYDSQYKNHVKYLCKGYYWSSCSYAVKTNQPSSKFSISDDKNKQIFNVTIKHLTAGDTDYYWCAVEINGGMDVKEYFHVSVSTGTPSLYVDRQDFTGYIGNMTNITCHSSNSKEIQWCRLGSFCVMRSSQSEQITMTTDVKGHYVNVSMTGLTKESSGWYLCVKGDLQMPVYLTVTEKPATTTHTTTTYLTMSSATTESVTLTSFPENRALTTVQHIVSVDKKSLVIALGLLISSVIIAVFIWFILKKHMQTKAAAAPSMTERSYVESEEDVIYSSVVATRQQNIQRVKVNEDNVIYSAVVYHI